jgi:hypothetical protein
MALLLSSHTKGHNAVCKNLSNLLKTVGKSVTHAADISPFKPYTVEIFFP